MAKAPGASQRANENLHNKQTRPAQDSQSTHIHHDSHQDECQRIIARVWGSGGGGHRGRRAAVGTTGRCAGGRVMIAEKLALVDQLACRSPHCSNLSSKMLDEQRSPLLSTPHEQEQQEKQNIKNTPSTCTTSSTSSSASSRERRVRCSCCSNDSTAASVGLRLRPLCRDGGGDGRLSASNAAVSSSASVGPSRKSFSMSKCPSPEASSYSSSGSEAAAGLGERGERR